MKQKIEMLDSLTRLAHPPIYNLTITGLPEYHVGLCFWGWVTVGDLTHCVNHLFSKKDIPDILVPGDIFTRYGLLCERDADQPRFTWVDQHVCAVGEVQPPENPAFCYIPAGWAEKVIEVARSGVIKVTSSPLVEHQKGKLDNHGDGLLFSNPPQQQLFLGPFVRHQIMGHNQDGTKCIISLGYETAQITQEAPSLKIFR